MTRFRWPFIFVAVLTLYLPALFGPFLWDDGRCVVENTALRDLHGLWRIWTDPTASQQYYPLTFTTFWLDYQMWGLRPLPYHLVNFLLHATNGVLAGLLLARLEVPGAWLASAVWTLHPVQVESVAWITERRNLLSATFALLSLLSWLRFTETKRATTYLGATAFFICALLSKTAICVLPVVILGLSWWRNAALVRISAKRMVAWLVVGVGASLLTAHYEHVRAHPDVLLPMLTRLDRLCIAARAVWFYTETLFWPAHLASVYPLWDDPSTLPLIALLTILVGLLIAYGSGRLRAGPLVAVGASLVLLTPTLGLIDFNFMRVSYVADRFQYYASLPFIALCVAAASLSTTRLSRRVRVAGAGCALAGLGVLTWQRGRVYGSEEAFWQAAIAANPRAWVAAYELGRAAQNAGRIDDAVTAYERALAARPDYTLAHNALGRIDASRGRLTEAQTHFRATLDVRPDDPEAHGELAGVLAHAGELDGAAAHYAAAAAAEPDAPILRYNLGLVFESQGKRAAAAEQYRLALRLAPGMAEAQERLAVLGQDPPAR